ncbi:MAG: hypothetical protein HQ475_14740 [SAR202 cluster bacterium]|nr:hypothetical protein [SAR202 cluster bacterium]
MKELLAALEELKRATASYAEALERYADALDPQPPTDKDKAAMESTAKEAEEWLKQN